MCKTTSDLVPGGFPKRMTNLEKRDFLPSWNLGQPDGIFDQSDCFCRIDRQIKVAQNSLTSLPNVKEGLQKEEKEVSYIIGFN